MDSHPNSREFISTFDLKDEKDDFDDVINVKEDYDDVTDDVIPTDYVETTVKKEDFEPEIKVKCEVCELQLSHKSIKEHIKRFHPDSVFKTSTKKRLIEENDEEFFRVKKSKIGQVSH